MRSATSIRPCGAAGSTSGCNGFGAELRGRCSISVLLIFMYLRESFQGPLETQKPPFAIGEVAVDAALDSDDLRNTGLTSRDRILNERVVPRQAVIDCGVDLLV